MADLIDRAQEVIEVCTEEAERRVRQRLQREVHPDFDGENCVECGDKLYEVRLKMGRVRCVPCQEEFETRQRAIGR